MKVSVITVVFNRAGTIAHAIESLQAQTCPAEHIVVDGASTDGTLEILRHNLGPSAQLVSEPDAGIYDAMNKGIRMATGDVIGILNADDVYADNDVLMRVSRIMDQDDLDALYGDVEFFHLENPDKVIRRYSSARFSPRRIAWGWMPAHTAFFLRRSVFDAYGLYRPDFRIAGDYEFVARIFKNDMLKYRYLPEVLVRMSTGGASTGGWRSTLLLNREVLRACRENGIRTNMLKLLSKYPLKALEFFRK
ncbi:MAG: glycosyltransferase family 2 protein [Azoarcus sp.]